MISYKTLLVLALATAITHLTLGQVSFTSVQSGTWEDGGTWGNTSPGVAGTDYPDDNSDDNVTIDVGHTVTLASNSDINNFTINAGGIFDYNSFTLTAAGTVTPFISVQTGTFSTNSTWLNGSFPGTSDRVIVVKGHTVNTSGNPQVISDITVDAGAVLSTNNNRDIDITSNLVVNGTVKLNQGNADLALTTASATVSGTGTIDGSESSAGAMQIEANAIISSEASLTFINDIDIENNVTLTNSGDIIVTEGDITGGNGSSQLTMGSNADLEIDGTLMSTGVLDASTNSGNTIEYNGTAAQTIKSPSSNTYENLIISGISTKTFPSNALTLNGDLEVNGGSLDVNNQNITIGGNWTNSATISNLSTVTFNGTSDQSVSTNGTNFTNLTINKSSGNLTLNEDVLISSTMTMTAGNINTGSNSITLGSGSEGTFNYTAGRIIGTFGRYIATGTTSQLTYPIGTSADDRTVDITFDQTGGGRQAGTVFASFIETDPGGSGFPVSDDVTLYNAFNEGYWDFTVSGFSKGNSNTFDLSLTGDGFSSFTIGSNTRMVQRDDAGTNWAADGTHGTVSSNTVSRNNITTFVSQFAFGDDTNCTGPSDPTVSGPTEVCINDTNDSYSVTLNSGNDYRWIVVGGTIDEASGNDTLDFTTNQNSITVDWSSSGQVGSVNVVERNGCTTSNQVSYSVNINSIAPASITGLTIVAENTDGVAYSVTNDANTNYSWTITGGTQATGGSTNSITVDWGSNGTGTVGVTATKTTPSCPASSETQLSVNKYIVIDSDLGGGSGNWDSDATWLTGAVPLASESARISAGETVTLAGGGGDDINNLIVEGTLDINSRDLTVSGDLTITSTGRITGTTGNIIMDGSLTSPQNRIDGTGTIEGGWTLEVTTASKTISSTAVINQSGTGTILNIDAGLTVTNEGSFEIGGNVTGDAASSTWTNSTNSTLTIGGTLLSTGTLNAEASGNTVVYNTATGADIKAAASHYQNVEIQTGIKTVAGATDVNGTLTLTSGTLAFGANNLSLSGNFTYTAGTVTATTGALILDGNVNQTLSGTVNLPNLTINNTLDGADAITVSNAITVSTTLTLTDGIIGTGSNILTVSNTATGGVSGGSSASFVNGILARQTNTTGLYDFPVGEGTTYKRVGITPTGTAGTTYQVEPFNSAYSDISSLVPALNNVSSIEYWDIQRTGTDNAAVRLYWNTEAASGITLVSTDLRVGHYTGGQWTDAGSASRVAGNGGYVESATVSAFSPFTFGSQGSSDNPLPVEWINFSAKLSGNGAVLSWSTASELNNDGFEVQRSYDGREFETIGWVGGNGTSQFVNNYNYTDIQFSSEAYYRLKQVDYDGAFEFSETIYVYDQNVSRSATIFPNPVNTNSQLILTGISIENSQIDVISMAGIKLNQHSDWTDPNEVVDFLTDLPPGMYFVNIHSKLFSKSLRVLRQ